MKRNGFENEYDFVELFNQKYLRDFDNNSKMFLKELFGDYIDNDEKIKSWKNKVLQKADIFIKYKNQIKSISIKSGNDNSIHHEVIEDFRGYLEKLGIPFKVIDYYSSYHYGYRRDENGKIDFETCLTADEYKAIYQNEIDIFNEAINKTRIMISMIDRFIVRGRNSEYDIDMLIHGTPNDYVWINKYDIYDMILSKRNNDLTSPHISCLTIGPKKRNIARNKEYAKERYIVCVRMNYLKDSIIEFKNNKLVRGNNGRQ